MRPKFFFDYIYFRVSQLYFKWDGKGSSTAVAAVTMVQAFTIAVVVGIVLKFFFNRMETAPYAKTIGIIWVILAGGLYVLNYIQYKDKYEKLSSFWKSEPQRLRRLKGFLVFVSIMLPTVLLILIAIYL